MSRPANDPIHDEDFKAVWGTCSAPDFGAWQKGNAEALTHLNPVVTRLKTQRRRLFMQACRLTATTLCLGLLLWFVGIRNESPAYAQALEQLKSAQTITWTRTYLSRATSADGQRSWIQRETTLNAYQQPGRYRETRLDASGKTISIEIRNRMVGQELMLIPERKIAVVRLNSPRPDDAGPFASAHDSLAKEALEFLGPEQRGERTVNFFRHVIPAFKNRSEPAYEFGIDAATKQLVEFRVWNSKHFDLETDPDRDKPAEPDAKSHRVLGSIDSEIVLGAELDESMFSLVPPEGYSVENHERATVTESEMVELLGAVARFNNAQFPDTALRALDLIDYNAIRKRPSKDWTDAERGVVELMQKFIMRYLDEGPIGQFIVDHTEPKTFRYIGKGVKLGDADRIVCWYKLKETGRYRAVYGDLQIKDVNPEDLPLEVE